MFSFDAPDGTTAIDQLLDKFNQADSLQKGYISVIILSLLQRSTSDYLKEFLNSSKMQLFELILSHPARKLLHSCRFNIHIRELISHSTSSKRNF